MISPLYAPRSSRLLAASAALAALAMALTPIADAADKKPAAELKLVAGGFVSPSVVVSLDDGSGRLLIADQVGTIHVLGKDGKLAGDLFLDLRERLAKLNKGFDERGLLGLALHPQFKENRKLYVYYSAPLGQDGPQGWNHTSHLSEFKARENNYAQADPSSERVILKIDQPQFNHNGGRIAFGPDGYLYIGMGDGGQGNDVGLGHAPQGNGQDMTTLLGKMLRIDVNSGNPYSVPKDNPFVSGAGRPEIFALGLRNPWGISFDRGGKHELFAVDVGQDRFEEINIIVKGGNYGWRIREGFGCFDPKSPIKPPEDCPKVGANGEPLLDPVLAYKNFKGHRRDPDAIGISITGGYVYRGKALPQLAGRYVFADWSRNFALPDGVMFVASRPASGSGPWTLEPLSLTSHPDGSIKAFIVALGEDSDGELYIMTNATNGLVGDSGKVYKLSAP